MDLSPARRARLVRWTPRTLLALALFTAPGLEAQAAIGLSSVRAQVFFNEEIEGFPPQEDDYFAYSLVAGDFDGDGAQDLATGVPFDDGPAGQSIANAGAVIVRWGATGKGLSNPRNPTLLSLYAPGGQAQAHADDRFGYALAAGDFNGDGREDLAVGMSNFNSDEGGVQIHYGEPGGIQLAGEHLFHSGANANIPDPPGTYDALGASLAAGDFDGDGYDDLAIGAPQFYNFGDPMPIEGGAVVVLHGGVGGLMPVVGYLIHQDDPPVPDAGENLDDFGWALAAGNFNGDFRFAPGGGIYPIDDLAMSAPGEDGIGAVMVMLGSEFGLIFSNSVYLGAGDVGGVGEAGDRFGESLAVGNFDGDVSCFPFIFCTGVDDLAIGAPFADLGAGNAIADAGEITVVYGVINGFFDLARTDHLTQGSIFGPASDQSGDRFGQALAAGDFDGDGREDLAAGHPWEDLAGVDRGGVTILMGGLGGLYDRFRFLATGVGGLLPGPQDGARVGFSLAVGDFDGSGFGDLAIGIPFRDQFGVGNAGAESILYGALFADGFAAGDGGFWSEFNP